MHPYFDGPTPHILAHRGLAISALENTSQAFVEAIKVGATHIETDVHKTKDGLVILFHDDNYLGRKTSALVLSDFPPGTTTLDEVLERFPATKFNIDIKDVDAIVDTAEVIRRHKAENRVLITSFSESRRRNTVKLVPGVATSASSPIFASAFFAAKLGIGPLVRLALKNIDAIQIPTKALGMRTLTTRTVKLFKEANVFIHVWTINDPVAMSELIELGADGVVTDRSDIAVSVLRPAPGTREI